MGPDHQREVDRPGKAGCTVQLLACTHKLQGHLGVDRLKLPLQLLDLPLTLLQLSTLLLQLLPKLLLGEEWAAIWVSDKPFARYDVY